MKNILPKSLAITVTIIFCSIASSAQWVTLFSGSPNLMIVDITQTPSGKLFAVGTNVDGTTYTPLIFRSQNDGSSWDTIIVPPTGYFFNTIAFLNDSIGYIGVGGAAYILQTTDGGNTWNYFYQDPSGTSINDIEVIDPTNAVACGFGQSLYSSGSAFKLTNQNHWYTISQSFPSVTLDDMQMLDADTGYVLSLYNKKLFKTINGGISWIPEFDFPSVVEKMYWWNSNSGIAVGMNASYYRTTDGGMHWVKDSISGYSNELTGVAFFDANYGYACGAGGQIFQSNDGGATFSPLPSTITTDLYNLEIHGNNAYALGAAGVIMRASIPTAIKEEKYNNIVNVYPNPADESIQINSSQAFDNINITDELGKIIYQALGLHTKTFSIDTRRFPNGFYFLHLGSKQNRLIDDLIIQH